MEDHDNLLAARADAAPRAGEDLDPAEPVEAAILEIAAWILVGHLDGGDPLRVLETELRRGTQPQRKPERIRDRLPGIFRRQDRLWMQRRRHVDRAVIV